MVLNILIVDATLTIFPNPIRLSPNSLSHTSAGIGSDSVRDYERNGNVTTPGNEVPAIECLLLNFSLSLSVLTGVQLVAEITVEAIFSSARHRLSSLATAGPQ